MPRHTENPGQRERGCVKRERALALRVLGTPYTAIGKEIGISGPMAHRYVKQALDKLAEKEQGNARIARQLDLARIDKGIAGLTPAYEGGDPKSVMAMARLLELRGKLLGTFAPARVEHTGDVQLDHQHTITLSDAERADRIQSLLGRAAARARLPALPSPNGHHVHNGGVEGR
jgi:hypothetical protein